MIHVNRSGACVGSTAATIKKLHPCSTAGSGPLHDADHQPTGSRLPARVYVVDDDHAVRAAVSLLVRSCGWEAVPCDSGADFLARYVPREAQCLVVDLRMPGLGGLDVQCELRRRGDRLPVIVITAHHDQPEADRARAGGARAVLGKPFHDEELLAYIRRALEASRAD